MSLKIGDSIIVKSGIKDPETESFEIGGWQGRVTGINKKSDKGHILISIAWDSATLEQMPTAYIHQSEVDELDWQSMALYESELEKTLPRDTPGDVQKAQELLSDKFQWSSYKEQGLRIAKILECINQKDEMKCLEKWVAHLESNLTFPVQAMITDAEDSRLIKIGSTVVIKALPHIVDLYGVIASIIFKGSRYEYPLCNLQALAENSADYQLIDDYGTWFANR